MSEYQSAYRKFHSTETALLCVQNDILVSLDFAHSTALLDLSATFDTINHNILPYRFKQWFGITSSALSSLSSFLTNRFQTLVASNSKSQPVLLEFGIPQGSNLEPLLSVHRLTPFYHLKIPWHPLSFLCGWYSNIYFTFPWTCIISRIYYWVLHQRCFLLVGS